MAGITGILTPYTLINNSLATGAHVSALFKRAAVLCDHIFVDPSGLGAPGDLQDHLIAAYACGGGDDIDSLSKSKDFRALVIRPQDIGDPEELMRQLHSGVEEDPLYYNAAVRFIEGVDDAVLTPVASPLRGVDYKTRGAIAIELSSDLNLPAKLEAYLERPVGIVTPWHLRVIEYAGSPSPEGARFPDLLGVVGTKLVDFADLSWSEILKLRHSQFVRDFRGYLDAVAADPASPDLADTMWNEMAAFAARSIPESISRTIIKGVLGNVPLLPVNPVSVGEALAATKKGIDMRKRFGWLFFVLEAKRLRDRDLSLEDPPHNA